MPDGEVERLEVVPVVFDFGTGEHAVAEADEDVFELAPHLRDEMQVAPVVAAPAEREVERWAGRGAQTLRDECFAALVDRGPDLGLRDAERTTDVLALLRRRRADRLAHLEQLRALAERPTLDLLELVERRDRSNRRDFLARDLGRTRRERAPVAAHWPPPATRR